MLSDIENLDIMLDSPLFELSDFMSKLSSQIQRVINEAIVDQTLPQIQATLKSEQGHMPERRWEGTARKLECTSEEALDHRFRSDSREECHRIPNRNEDLDSTHDMVTGDSESLNKIFDCHTRRTPSRFALNQPPRDHNDHLAPPCLQQNKLPQWPYKTQITELQTC